MGRFVALLVDMQQNLNKKKTVYFVSWLPTIHTLEWCVPGKHSARESLNGRALMNDEGLMGEEKPKLEKSMVCLSSNGPQDFFFFLGLAGVGKTSSENQRRALPPETLSYRW